MPKKTKIKRRILDRYVSRGPIHEHDSHFRIQRVYLDDVWNDYDFTDEMGREPFNHVCDDIDERIDNV